MLDKIKQKLSDFNARRELLSNAPQLQKCTIGLDSDGLVDLLYSERWQRFFWIKQVPSEIKGLTKAVAALKPKVVVEVGSNMGGSLFLFTKVADPAAHVISIDLPGGLGGGGYPLHREPFYKSFAVPPQKIDLIRGDSHDQDIYQRMVTLLGGRMIDFLFLDGDHSYNGIKMDFEMYSPHVRSGGLVAFHDIKPSLPDNWRQVGPYWEELKHGYAYQEICSDEVSWGGIGIVTMP